MTLVRLMLANLLASLGCWCLAQAKALYVSTGRTLPPHLAGSP